MAGLDPAIGITTMLSAMARLSYNGGGTLRLERKDRGRQRAFTRAAESKTRKFNRGCARMFTGNQPALS
jgi:hypothetical protein